MSANTQTNDANFSQSNGTYIGNIITAYSLNIGKRASANNKLSPALSTDDVAIAEILDDSATGEKRLIGSNVEAIQSYLNVLRIDILSLLANSPDRAKALDEHIELLKSYYLRTLERTNILATQMAELRNIVASTTAQTEAAKATMQEKYKNFEYEGINSVIEDYIRAKNEENRARVYLTYTEQFSHAYGILQGQNKKTLDTLINNHDALVKDATVVIPDSGTEILKRLNLVQSEADFKASNQ